jgi:phosphatidylethanolamine/phosphatidyl-N-methylethanolamine N-methyltransferase
MLTHLKKYLLIGCFFFLSAASPAELLQFVSLGLKKNATVGALFECSEYTGEELIKHMKRVQQASDKSCSIIEVGAGQGAVSKVIIEHLRPQDTLVLIELMPEFCDVLRKKFPPEKFPNVRIINDNILDHNPSKQYDVCICTLPFNGFTPQLTQAILEKMQRIIKVKGYFSYVAYAFLPTIRYYLLKWGNSRKEFFEQLSLMQSLNRRFQFDRSLVWRNMPPIYIHHLQFDAGHN